MKLKFSAPAKPGVYHYTVVLRSDSYYSDFDQQQNIKVLSVLCVLCMREYECVGVCVGVCVNVSLQESVCMCVCVCGGDVCVCVGGQGDGCVCVGRGGAGGCLCVGR